MHPVMHAPSERALRDKIYEEQADGTLKLFIEAVCLDGDAIFRLA